MSGCVGGSPGIFDINGNVYEWEDACDVSAGPSDACLIRGGSWNFSGATYGGCTTYFNDYSVLRSNTFNDTGIRCCSP
jgi:formylglycine-generating enzyme required for sulfatase activity